MSTTTTGSRSRSRSRGRATPPPPQHRRVLYEFVTPNVRDCTASGLLQTCPYYVTSNSNNSRNSNNGSTDLLFHGNCPSNLQQQSTDNWCYDSASTTTINDIGREVCCGIDSSDCCEVSKTYVAVFVLVAMMVLSPIVILCICAYGRCCIGYPKLWNAKSNRGCGQPRQRLPSEAEPYSVSRPHSDKVDDNDDKNRSNNDDNKDIELVVLQP